MMTTVELPKQQRAFLTGYRLPEPRFTPPSGLLPGIELAWQSLSSRNHRGALVRARRAFDEQVPTTPEEVAALKVALAAAELHLGGTEEAKRLAGQSLELYPHQWLAHRILLMGLIARHDYKAAYLHLLHLPCPEGPTATWDEPLSALERELALAAWAWMMGEWETVAQHLLNAWPNAPEEMPDPIREDWFRLSLYRNRPDDAAAAAALLIESRSVEQIDEMLQTFTQTGLTKQALVLYRQAWQRMPQSQVLRRRLVALCIRERAFDEARRLTEPGALVSLAA
jgi:hypothetical protein